MGLADVFCRISASPTEVKLLAKTVDERFVADVPERLIGDKAYDSDGLNDQLMQEYATEVIPPQRSNRRRDNVTQYGQALRRYARRWKIDRFVAWLGDYRRLVVRWEHYGNNFIAFST